MLSGIEDPGLPEPRKVDMDGGYFKAKMGKTMFEGRTAPNRLPPGAAPRPLAPRLVPRGLRIPASSPPRGPPGAGPTEKRTLAIEGKRKTAGAGDDPCEGEASSVARPCWCGALAARLHGAVGAVGLTPAQQSAGSGGRCSRRGRRGVSDRRGPTGPWPQPGCGPAVHDE